jgi:hypothetical protein
MAIILPGGFQITNNEPVDARLTVADSTSRLGFSPVNVYEGLVVYQRDNNKLYVLVDTGSYNTESGWELVGSGSGGGGNTFPYTGSAIISGSLNVIGSITGSDGIINQLTASYAISSSYADTASFSLATTENRVLVINKSGTTITKGMVVHLTGSNNSSNTPYVITASYENDTLSANTLGIASQTIAFNDTGYITTEGVLTGIDVTGLISGQLIYLGATGSITGSAPLAPLHAVRLGQVVRDSPSNNGAIYVRINNGYEIGELHDVRDTTTTSSYGDLLVKSGSVWINSKQLTGSYGLTGSLNITGSLSTSINGTASLNTQNRTLYDSSGADCIDWGNKFLQSSGANSLSWSNRILYDLGGDSVLEWDPINEVITLKRYLQKFIRSNTQENFSNQYNYEGEIIEGVFDGSINNLDLIFLDTDGVWYPVNQTTTSCEKMLGICADINDNKILLEGTIVVSSTGISGIEPYVQSLTMGSPIYIREGSGNLMSCIIPDSVGEYVRILGYAYYQNQNDTDLHIMKFKPSNEWYTI